MIKKKLISPILLVLLSFFSGFVAAIDIISEQPLIDIKIGIELSKLETSANNIDQSIKQASEALQEMAKPPNISPEQQAQIMQTFENIEQLSTTFQDTIKEIPATITKSTPPILTAVDNLFANIQLTIIVSLMAILVILISALIALYFWILKPTSLMLLKTISKVDNMAIALQTTAEIVDKTTQQQLLILNHTSVKK
jgi:hypothetical protein